MQKAKATLSKSAPMQGPAKAGSLPGSKGSGLTHSPSAAAKHLGAQKPPKGGNGKMC